jgi:hypothetical protein
VIGQVLIQFVLRLTYGIALGLGLTPARLVGAAFFRVPLWTLMAANAVVAGTVLAFQPQFANGAGLAAMAVIAALLCGGGAVLWQQEKVDAGGLVVLFVALAAALGSLLALEWPQPMSAIGVTLAGADLLSSGLILAVGWSAAWLGYRYLHTPKMKEVPLPLLVRLLAVAVGVRTVLAVIAVLVYWFGQRDVETSRYLFLGLRWLCGLLGWAMLGRLAHENHAPTEGTGSAALLYSGVLFAFLGEVSSQLVAVDSLYPV